MNKQNPLFKQVIFQRVWNHLKQNHPGKRISNYDVAKEFYKIRVTVTHWFKDAILITLGIFSASFGLEGFLLPNSFIDGGVTGISLLVAVVSSYPLPILIVVINMPFMILGYKVISSSFAIKSLLAVIGLAVVVALVHFPVITSDKLLISVFGGFFLGAGIGLSIRGGGVLDGTEVLAIYLSRRTGLTIGDVILLFNILIFGVAAYLLSIETALYSILAYLAASKTVDFIVEGVEEYIGFTIVSSHSEEIRMMITDKMGRGVTIFDGKRGYGKKGSNLDRSDIVYTVITRLEIAKLQTEIEKLDPNAFTVMSSVKNIRGGLVKKRPLQH